MPFEILKATMTTTHILATLGFSKPFVTESSELRNGIGVLRMLEGWLITLISKGLSRKNLGKFTYEKWIIAILQAKNNGDLTC